MTSPVVSKKSDSQLKHDVLDELKWDTRVKETDVGVEVKGTTVTLTGSVDSWTARLAAEDAAHRVAGVLDVANDIKVKLASSNERDDSDLARAVRTALEWDVLVPSNQIRSTISNGDVTLEGKVDYWSQYEDAARAIRNLPGVRGVRNLIQVEPSWPQVAPEKVRSAIERALERHAEHAAKGVRVAIENNKVVLTGQVPSRAELSAIEGAARGTPGVIAVDNRVRIQP
jgi:osmotically-inducible protein OsmY